MGIIDLHTHSTASDGKFTPAKLVKYGSDKGVIAIALTDHDTVSGIDEFMRAGKMYNVETIPGVELSIDHPGTVHLVGLFLDIESPGMKKLHDALEINRNERVNKTLLVVERLKELEIYVEYEDILALAKGDMIGKPQIAEAIANKGYARDIADACEQYLNEGRPAYIKKNKMSAEDGISLIHQARGIAVLAHPRHPIIPFDEVEKRIAHFAQLGVDAVEAFCSEHDKETTDFVVESAKKHNLLVSGGSDFHGKAKKGVDLGTGRNNLCIRYEVLERLKERRDYITTLY